MPAIGGEAAQTPGAIDSLTSGGGSPAAASPNGPAAGADQHRAQLMAFAQELRGLDEHIKQVYGKMPSLQQFMQQHLAITKQAIQKAAQAVPAQTGSSEAVPTSSQ